MRRRAAASASRERVSSFSFTSISVQAFCHSCADTTGGLLSAAICSLGIMVGSLFRISVGYHQGFSC